MTVDRRATARGALAVGALGVVFGDIGTSPLYTLQTVFNRAIPIRCRCPRRAFFGIVSLIFWSVTIRCCVHGDCLRRGHGDAVPLAGFGALWVTNGDGDRSVSRINPAAGVVTRTLVNIPSDETPPPTHRPRSG